LKEGDIITKVDGVQILSPSDLQERIGRLGPGDKVQLTYLRDAKPLVTTVTLKGEESVKTANNSSNGAAAKNLGANFAPISDALKKKYKINAGVVVSSVKPGGFFDQLDVAQGTVITSINGRQIAKVEDIETAISSGRNNMATINAISPDGMQIRYQFQVK
jgi:S1-C subfamily serine protease